MLFLKSIQSILEVLIVIVPSLLTVAFVTVAERKTMASMQRRLGPNVVGAYGLLQAFADALKLLLKEYISPSQANLILFFLGPIITLIFSLLGYAVLPFGPGLAISDFNLGILYMLAVSSLATYGILLAGWSANSKYAFLGSLRSTAQLISYELILSSAIFLVLVMSSSLNLTANIESQKAVWFLLPLFPIFIIFFVGAIAETNRAPFDLAEAESELVSGFMTEHSAVIFVFFFLAEYASIILICVLISILYIGGYSLDYNLITTITHTILYPFTFTANFVTTTLYLILLGIYLNLANLSINPNIFNLYNINDLVYDSYMYNTHVKDYMLSFIHNKYIENIIYGIIVGIKSFTMVFAFIWVRASFPRIRFDQLMSYCWTVLLPIVFAFILSIPCLLYILDIVPHNVIY